MKKAQKTSSPSQRNSFPECRMRPEAPAIEINGETIPPIAYTSYLPRSKYYAEVAQCGLHLYSFPAYIAHRGINMLPDRVELDDNGKIGRSYATGPRGDARGREVMGRLDGAGKL